ncbi:MarR family winged helix-turn-helix transcriptional regulator [Arthrobacter glacialis]|uniref:MarR family winged helix-turn-helix transcriptional regulator n=1 Tax=Arthrobacter glacialis TaxID=1664 RepID=UPI001FAEF840|nr:MarR family winged helix-turn-helix transcriptional regulator [Arthrobacter glacialis]
MNQTYLICQLLRNNHLRDVMAAPEITAEAIAEPRWLTEKERQLWLELVEFSNGLPRAIDRQLSRDSEVSGVEYSILASISEASPDGVRSGDLAARLQWERSRLSHLLRRMEARGLIGRCAASTDGRGQEISLTEAGWAKIRSAAPGHVTMVRETIFDPISVAQQEQLLLAIGRIREAFTERGLW